MLERALTTNSIVVLGEMMEWCDWKDNDNIATAVLQFLYCFVVGKKLTFVYCLLVTLRSYYHLCSQHVGSDQKNKVRNSGLPINQPSELIKPISCILR